MSIDSARAFIRVTGNDPALLYRMERLGIYDIPSLIKFGAAEGYSFDAEELAEAVHSTTHELDESELERVAGGLNPQPEPPGAPLAPLAGQKAHK